MYGFCLAIIIFIKVAITITITITMTITMTMTMTMTMTSYSWSSYLRVIPFFFLINPLALTGAKKRQKKPLNLGALETVSDITGW